MAVDSTGRGQNLTPGRAATDLANEVLGRRVLAGFLDLAVLAVLFVVMSIVFGGVHTGTVSNVSNPGFHQTNDSLSLTAGPFALFVVLCLAYYFVLESRSGQTIGKRALGLRVVDVGGAPLTKGAVLRRTLGRLIDVLPFLYLVGLVAIGWGDRRQRLGDRLAHTTVTSA